MLVGAGALVNHAMSDEESDGITPLMLASQEGHLRVVLSLLAAHADVDQREEQNGTTALHFASQLGHASIASALLAAGADVNRPLVEDAATPSFIASFGGHLDVLSVLLDAHAAVDTSTGDGMTAIMAAALEGHLSSVQCLSSHGAARTVPLGLVKGLRCSRAAERRGSVYDAVAEVLEELAVRPTNERREQHAQIASWLSATASWSTPLHHLRILTAARARRLLRQGASVHACAPTCGRDGSDVGAAGPAGATPLSLAEQMRANGEAPEGSAAALVLQASAQWSPANHALFPAGQRAWAWELLILGHRLAHLPCFEHSNSSAGLVDVWIASVMPHLVHR